ncbi:MAG: hypothetical protein H6981_01245 [Gammaproteobacteria bacterium]|nr:hypothetical protein [Gammaproteobacteria bacterium]MCP5135411.1 hypothetical protein [Gammaproteobacteria bacterium]
MKRLVLIPLLVLSAHSWAEDPIRERLEEQIQSAALAETERNDSLKAAEYAARLLELQARAATALRRCSDLGVPCGLEVTTPTLPPMDESEVDVDAATPATPTPASSVQAVDAPAPSVSPMAYAAPTPTVTALSLPRLVGVIGERAQFDDLGDIIEARAGEALPSGWVVKSISLRGSDLAGPDGETRRLVLRWGDNPSPAGPRAPATPQTGNALPYLPPVLPGWPQ